MNLMKRVFAMLGVILVAGIWVGTFLIAVLGGPKDLLTAFIVLSVLVPVLIWAMLLIRRLLSGKNKEEAPAPDASSDKKP